MPVSFFKSSGGSTTTPVAVSSDSYTLKVVDEPTSISSGEMELYLSASGESPNKVVSLVAKFEDGTNVILSSIVV